MPAPFHHLLVADIGGTHCRFAHFTTTDNNKILLQKNWHEHTASFKSFRALIIEAHKALPAIFDAITLAVPGAIDAAQTVKCPNIPWPININNVPELPQKTFLINDLEAQAWGCLLPSRQHLLPLFPGDNKSQPIRNNTVRAVLGAGTGLGCCLLIGSKTSYRTLPSELGHALLPIDDTAYADYLCKQSIRADGDHLLSGRGLSTLVEFYTKKKLSPEKAASYLSGTHMETRYARILGILCQTLVLSSLCLEGLYLCGGVLTSNPSFVLHPEFHRSLCNCPGFETLLRDIPINLVQNTDSGLWGAALFTQTQLNTL